MRLYSIRHAIKKGFNLAENLRSNLDQKGNTFKLTFIVSSQKETKVE